MKEYRLRSIALIAVYMLAVCMISCKKEYSCHCYIIDPTTSGGPAEYQSIVQEHYETVSVDKSDEAVEACKAVDDEPLDPQLTNDNQDLFRRCYVDKKN